MNFFTKLLIVIGVIFSLIFIKDNFFAEKKQPVNNLNLKKFERKSIIKRDIVTSQKTDKISQAISKKSESNIVGIYFTDKEDGDLRCLYKELPQGKSKLNYAMKVLLDGPSLIEIQQGYSSEIPKGTRLLEIKETPNAYIVNISDEFQYGGGTESQYLRLNQLIKTVVHLKLNKPTYLYLNGRKAEVIGGEGILITQPLSEKSLNE